MNIDALTHGPVITLVNAFALLAATGDLLANTTTPRRCCRPDDSWRYHLDALLGRLIPARAVAWSFLLLACTAEATLGHNPWSGLAVAMYAYVLWALRREYRHRKGHRRDRDTARARGRVVNLGHRLAVDPT